MLTGRRVRSIARAAAFVDDVGFALLFPSERVLVPSLWEAVAGEDAEPFASGMGSDERIPGSRLTPGKRKTETASAVQSGAEGNHTSSEVRWLSTSPNRDD